MRLVLVCLLLAASTAHADKDRNVALAASGVGAGVSSAIALSSIFIGTDAQNQVNMPLFYVGLGSALVTPSLGQFYAGEGLTVGMGVRAAAAGLALLAITSTQETVACDDPRMTGCKAFTESSFALFGLAGIAYVGGVAWDVMDAGDAVDRWNARHHVAITPMIGARGYGLYFSATY